MAKSRRKSREAALSALYQIDIGGAKPEEAMENAIEEGHLEGEQAGYARRIVQGVREHQGSIDADLAGFVKEYDYERLAAVDRNVLRLAAYELSHEPAIPPAVTLDEAIEIAKRFSTAESGRFVNGVLGRYLLSTDKATWSPETAPPEEAEEPILHEEVPPVEVVEEGSEEAKVASRFGRWQIRAPEE